MNDWNDDPPTQPDNPDPLSKRETPHDQPSFDPLFTIQETRGKTLPAERPLEERSLALIALILKEQILSEEEILALLEEMGPLEKDPFQAEQFLLKKRVLNINQYLHIQQTLNSASVPCQICKNSTYSFEKKSSEKILCTSCLLLNKSNPTYGIDRAEVAQKMELLETFFTPKKTGMVGQIWDGYKIIEELGRGGMGVVYKAFQMALSRTVALKVIRDAQSSNKKRIQRFLREARALATLRHPCIVNIYDIGTQEGQYYFTMDFISGRPLTSLIHEKELTPQQGARLIRDIAYALDYAHGQGIVHRDLKPPNILITPEGKPVVMDFGLAKILEDNDEEKLTRTGAVVGTPLYMAPEQITGEFGTIDRQTDVYALGVILYEILAGQPPFLAGSNVEVYKKIMQDDPADVRKFNPAVPRDLDTICRKALEKDKTRRYSSAGELAGDLERFVAGDAITARRATLAERGYRKVKKNPWISLFTTLILLVALSFGYYKGTEPAYLKILSLKGTDQIFIDGKKSPSSPSPEGLLELSLPAGKHKIKIRRKDYFSYYHALEVSRGEVFPLSPEWKSRYGSLKILSLDGKEKIYLDGKSLEYQFLREKKMGRARIALGTYTVEIRRKLHHPFLEKIEIASDKEGLITPEFVRHKGYLTLNSQPYQVDITLKGTSLKGLKLTVPLMKFPLPTGQYTLDVFRKNYLTRQYKIQIRKGKETRLYVSLYPMLRWQFSPSFSTSWPLALEDINGDGYLDIFYQDEKFIGALDGRTTQKLWYLRSAHTLSTEKFEEDKHLRNIRLGNPNYISPHNLSSSQNFWIWGKGYKSRIFLNTQGSTRTFDREGFYRGGFYGTLSQFGQDPEGKTLLYSSRQNSRYKYQKVGTQLRYVKFGMGYQLRCFRDFHFSNPLWTKFFLEEELEKFKGLSVPRGVKPVYLLMEPFLVAMNPQNQQLIWTYKIEDKIAWKRILQKDFDGDGLVDFIVLQSPHLLCISGRTGKLLWREKVDFHPQSRLIASDLDGDGIPEIVAFDNHSNLVAWRLRKPPLWKYPLARVNNPQGLAKADVDRDGVSDLVVTSGRKLLYLSGKDGRLLSEYYCPSVIQNTPLIGDINGDGFVEALIKDSQKFYCIQLHRASSWYQNLDLRMKFVSLEKSILKMIQDRDLLLYDSRTGRMLKSLPLLQGGEEYLLEISQSLLSGHLAYGQGKFRLIGSRGKTLWAHPFSFPRPLTEVERLNSSLIRLSFQADKPEETPHYGYLYVRKKGDQWEIILFIPSKNHRSLLLYSISPSSHQTRALEFFTGQLWERLDTWIPRVISGRLIFPSGRPYLHQVDLDTFRSAPLHFRHIYLGKFLRDLGLLEKKGKEEIFWVHLDTSLQILNPQKGPLWGKYLHRFATKTYLAHEKVMQEKNLERRVTLFQRGKAKHFLLSFLFYDREFQARKASRTYLAAIEGRSGKILWTSTLREPLIEKPLAMDLDSDGEEELILSTPDRIEIISSKKGYLMWSYPLKDPKILKILPAKKGTPPHILVRSTLYLHYLPILLNRGKLFSTFVEHTPFQKREVPQRREQNIDYTTAWSSFYEKTDRMNAQGKLPEIEEMEKIFPGNFFIKKRKALLYMSEGEYHKAIDLLERLRLYYPDNYILLINLSRAYFGLKEYYKAYFYIEVVFRSQKLMISENSQWISPLVNQRKTILKKILSLEKERWKTQKTSPLENPAKTSPKPKGPSTTTPGDSLLSRVLFYLRLTDYSLGKKDLDRAKRNLKKAREYYQKALKVPCTEERKRNVETKLKEISNKIK